MNIGLLRGGSTPNAENANAPQTFIKLKATARAALASFGGDELAMASAHRQATAASQPLIAELFKHGAPVPMIRMDWMVKRRGPGAQVVFGVLTTDTVRWAPAA